MNAIENIIKEYTDCLKQQSFGEKDLDYSAIEKYLPMLKNLSLIGNNGVYVFDLHRKENIFTYYNFTGLYGYDQNESDKKSNEFFISKIHPDDFSALLSKAIVFLNFLFSIPKEERSQYKLVSEYRILGDNQKYVNVLEQYQVLEFDKHGHVWFALGIIDISPVQNESTPLHSQIINYKSGDYFLLKDGKTRSVEITKFKSVHEASVLSEAVTKVNSQRKKIIEKLHAENAAGVTKRILKYGLLE